MYNTKYILNFCNRDRVPVRVEIQIKDYVGEAFILVNDDQYLLDNDGRYVTANIDGSYDPDRDMSAIEGGASPFVLNYMNDVGDKTGAIRASSADMKFYENLLFNIDDLATSDETEIRIQLFYDNEIEWVGFVTPDFFNVEITPNPLINLTASDRIGILKDVPYALTSDIEERVRLIDIVSNILKETGLELNINILCQMYCDEFPDYVPSGDYQPYEANNPFLDTWVSEYRFADDFDTLDTDDCYTILQSILNQFNCFLTQYKGEWWIINKQDQEQGGGVVFVFDADGQYQSMGRAEFGERTFSLIDTGGQRTIMPAFSRVTLNLDHGENVIYPKNSRILSDVQVISGAPKWTSRQSTALDQFDTSIPTLYNLNGTVKDSYNNEFRVLTVRSSQITTLASDHSNFLVVPSTVPANSWILSSDEFKVVTVDGKKSAFKFSAEVINKPGTAVMIGLFMKIKNTSTGQYEYFLARRYPNTQSGRAVDYTNEYWFYKINFTSDENLMAIPIYKKGDTENIGIASSYKHEFEMSIAAGQGQADLDLNDAFFFIRIYPNVAYRKGADGGNSAYNNELETVISKIKSLSIDFLSDNQTPTGTIFESRIDGKFTKIADRIDVLFGDYQMYGQNGFFYRYREDSLSIQYNSLGERLQSWYTKTDSERNPILIHSLRQISKSTSRAYDELKIGFDMGNINPLCQYAVRCVSDNKKYVFVEGTIDYLTSHFSGVLAQMPQSSIEREEYIYSILESNGNN